MATLNDVDNFIRQNAEICEFGPAASDELIQKAEIFLGLRFPDDYREFLRRWGTLSIGPYEYYGICGDNFESSTVPDGIWYTNIKRQRVDFPKDLIIIYSNEGDEYYCLGTNDPAESPILIWDPGSRQIIGTKAASLAQFILNGGADFLEWPRL